MSGLYAAQPMASSGDGAAVCSSQVASCSCSVSDIYDADNQQFKLAFENAKSQSKNDKL